MRYIAGLAFTLLCAYFTAQTATKVEITRLQAIQETQFAEILRTIQRIEVDVREVRRQGQ